MKVTWSPGAAEYVRARGGRLYVWATAKACCGGTRFVEASTTTPPNAERFLVFPVDGFELLIRSAGPYGLPEELHVDLGGIRRRRLRASWNGCAFVV